MRKKLHRSKKEKMIAGVCGGLSEYFDIDPVIVRIIFIAAALITGTGFLVYLLLWIIVPYGEAVELPDYDSPVIDEAEEIINTAPPAEKKTGHGLITGYVLIAVGILFLADRFIPHFNMGDFWPLVIIAIGAGLLLKSSRNNKS
ncbi:MAG: PspC domain-containing protein [Ignavibacteria bacterium]